MPWILSFLTFVLVVYFGGHAYILAHISSFLEGYSWSYFYYILYSVLVIWWLVARILDNRALPRWSDIFLIVGSFALPWMFYATFFLLVYDVIWFVAWCFDRMTIFDTFSSLWWFFGVHIFVALWLIFWYINARNPKIIPYTVTYEWWEVCHDKSITIALLTDVHIGTLNQWKTIERIVDTVNAARPDLILFAGDIFDGSLDVVQDRNLHLPLAQLHAPLWVYGAYGNHEYYGDPEVAKWLLESVGITMLQDEWRVVGDIYLVGRDDRSVHTMRWRNRLDITMITASNTSNLPIILLDHQPSHLERAEEAGVALQLSGHTHNGQLWPLGLMAKIAFEKNIGYHRRSHTHYVISAWAATWWFPIKTSAKSEIPLITFQY